MTVILKPKTQLGTEDQVRQETVARDNTIEREKERELIKTHDSTETPYTI